MSYPNEVTADLVEINGSSCGTITGVLEFVDGSDPPEYINNSGDYAYARLWQIDLANGSYSWQLRLYYRGGGSCAGLHDFQLTTPADDPVGNYCKLASGQVDCGAGKAVAISND